MSIIENVQAEFTQRFGEPPAYIVRAPGRVNIIGEHTDYNDGFVLPMAIDRSICIALRPRDDDHVQVIALDFDTEYAFDLNDIQKAEHTPAEYIKGVAHALQGLGHNLRGWQGVMQGDIPIAAGLSSSAALEMASARAFCAVSGIEWNSAQMAKVGQQAENDWIGLKTGIMDQMISASGKEGYALLIDCRSLETQLCPLPPDTVIVVMDTTTQRGLVDSAYNERREQCEAAAQFFGVPALRDVTLETFEARASGLDDLTRRRAQHIITENDRVLSARDAMHAGDAATLGQLMNASHASLRDDFQVSSDALNTIVWCAQSQPACYGARMTGAGFGGCAVALIRADSVEEFTGSVAACYEVATRLKPRIYVTTATDGAQVVYST